MPLTSRGVDLSSWCAEKIHAFGGAIPEVERAIGPSRTMRKHCGSCFSDLCLGSLFQSLQIGKKIMKVGLRELIEQLAMGCEWILYFDLHMVAREGTIPA